MLANPADFALFALLGLLGLRIFEACGANIADLGEEHGRPPVLRVTGKGGKVVLVPLPPAVARGIDRAVDEHVQIGARHTDPRTTMRYDRARKNLDRHPSYILAAYMASGT
ncbi:hypothetical protein O7626_26260 [Micromonospora sp. WMMD1102]|uniref:hypothetical protein n=1 Tax=Micromonospora sp. WMMD1102 TaxID=3016105 RepID=UPI002414D39D|nr:hypothetical protein [Micromonospora sp. WMMD1102]MDG4789386.1 hypothetical protein [Micromonospora sp. WMMD1102]